MQFLFVVIVIDLAAVAVWIVRGVLPPDTVSILAVATMLGLGAGAAQIVFD